MFKYNGIRNDLLKHLKFINFIVVLCLLAFIRIVFSLDVPVVLFIAVSVIASLFCTKEENVTLMISLGGLSACFQYRWALGLVALIYALKMKKIRICYMLPFFLMVGWELMHAGQAHLNAYSFLREFTELFALSLILADRNIDYSDGFPLRCFSYMTVIGSFFCFISVVKLHGNIFYSLARLGINKTLDQEQLFLGLFNSNVLSYICVLSISGLLLLRYYNQERMADKLIIYFLIFVIILTQSKSALICLLLTYILYYLSSSHKLTIETIRNFIGGVAVFLTCIFTFLNNFIDSVIARFLVSDITSGRMEITKFYCQHLINKIDNLLYGIGLCNYTKQIERIYGNLGMSYPGTVVSLNGEIAYLPAHNNIQEILVVWGVVGCFLCMFLFYMIFKHTHREVPKANCITFLIMLIYGLQGQFLSNGIMLLSLLYSIVCLEYSIGVESKNLKET